MAKSGDTISRQAAIDICTSAIDLWNGQLGEGALVAVRDKIAELPSEEEESFEWCTDCKEYDQESHCCHRFTKVIRRTVEEMKLVHCVDCVHSEYDVTYGDRYCHYNGKADVVDDYHFCRDGERREVTT